MRFWVAWFPLWFTQSPDWKKRAKIFDWLSSLNLDALELQMTYGPRMKSETCELYRELAWNLWIRLSVHAAYYIVLTSSEASKIQQSFDTLKRTYELAYILGAKEIVLHPWPLYKIKDEIIKEKFIENMLQFFQSMWKTDIWLYIETAGKIGQLGSVNDIFEISSYLEWVHPCLDFWHIHARTLWTLDKKENIQALESQILDFLIKFPEKNLHFHYTPIHYGCRGEIQHRAINDSYSDEERKYILPLWKHDADIFHPRPDAIVSLLRNIPQNCTLISETHNSQEIGAQTLKQLYFQN